MRFLGLDYGDKTIGVAVSDPEGRVAVGVETLRRDQPEALRASVRRLEAIIKQYGVETIVLGYPKKMDNSQAERCEKTLLFKAKLERNFKRVPIQLWDERLSTAAVNRVRADGRPVHAVDEMAAAYILQGYLDFIRREQVTMQGEMDNQFEWNAEDGSAITLFDDDGNEADFYVLASHEHESGLYLLVAESQNMEEGEDGDESDEDEVVEVLHFKCIANEDEDMTFELVDEEHEDFEQVTQLFKEDYEALGIHIDE